jgi:hypothetical protein
MADDLRAAEEWNRRYKEFLKKQAEAHIPPKARIISNNTTNWNWPHPVTSKPESEAAPDPKKKRNLVDWYGD